MDGSWRIVDRTDEVIAFGVQRAEPEIFDVVPLMDRDFDGHRFDGRTRVVQKSQKCAEGRLGSLECKLHVRVTVGNVGDLITLRSFERRLRPRGLRHNQDQT
jgi:hypothetical protein